MREIDAYVRTSYVIDLGYALYVATLHNTKGAMTTKSLSRAMRVSHKDKAFKFAKDHGLENYRVIEVVKVLVTRGEVHED